MQTRCIQQDIIYTKMTMPFTQSLPGDKVIPLLPKQRQYWAGLLCWALYSVRKRQGCHFPFVLARNTGAQHCPTDMLQQELGFNARNNYFSREKSDGDDRTL